MDIFIHKLLAATARLKMLNRSMRLIERVSRTIILIVGVMVVTGTLLVLNTYANRIVPAWLRKSFSFVTRGA